MSCLQVHKIDLIARLFPGNSPMNQTHLEKCNKLIIKHLKLGIDRFVSTYSPCETNAFNLTLMTISLISFKYVTLRGSKVNQQDYQDTFAWTELIGLPTISPQLMVLTTEMILKINPTYIARKLLFYSCVTGCDIKTTSGSPPSGLPDRVRVEQFKSHCIRKWGDLITILINYPIWLVGMKTEFPTALIQSVAMTLELVHGEIQLSNKTAAELLLQQTEQLATLLVQLLGKTDNKCNLIWLELIQQWQMQGVKKFSA